MRHAWLVAVLAAGLVAPAAAQAVLVVEVTPEQAVVFVDGQAAVSLDARQIGPGVVAVPVAAGRHTVMARLGRHGPASREVRVAAGDTLRVTLTLARQMGRVRVEGVPPDADVISPGRSLDGGDLEVAAGGSLLRVQLPDGTSVETRAQVEPGMTTTVRYHPARFTLRPVLPNLIAPGAAQFVGGRKRAGLAYALAVGATLGTGLAGSALLGAAKDDLGVAVAAYEITASEPEAVAAWEVVEAGYGRVQQLERRRTVAYAAAVVFQTASLVDAALFHGRRPRLEAGPPGVAWELRAAPEGVAVRLRF